MSASMRQVISGSICALLTAAMTSCASLNINAVPMPGSAHRDGYDVVTEFANVLNLPDAAKVVMDGTTVGVVTKVGLVGDHVDVTARIDPGVQVPSNIHAALQQATVLGDIYVALDRGEDAPAAGPPLGPGGRIPLAQTTSPPQLEDTIANLANFIGSGSIQRAQKTLMRINQLTPPRDEVRRVVSHVTTDLGALSDNVDTVDQMLSSINESSTVLAAGTPALSFWFSHEGIDGFRRDMVMANTFGRLLPSLGSIYNGGYWLVPLIRSLAGALESVQGSKQAVEAEYPAYRNFINDYFLRQEKYPAINITSIVGPDGRELSGNVEQVLRMLGAVS
jgi:phospholipid/cholesterol/gamma-HCH transport system substrate-binding protein